MTEIKNLLIVANSGQMLAQFAKNVGFTCLVIDCFSDVDTQALAKDTYKVNTLALENLELAFSYLNNKYDITYAIYGSGLEFFPSSLEFLHKYLIVLGNSVNVFTKIHSKACLFSKLKLLRIPCPQYTFHPPKTNDNWLVKPLQGEGGVGIKKHQNSSANSSTCYWQEYIEGDSMSVIFVANGVDYEIYGFQQQMVTQVGDNPFVFAGVVSSPEINDVIKKQVSLWIVKLLTIYCLKGINTLDFIVNNQSCYFLEINARPSASMQLYDENIFLAHINSFFSEKRTLHVRAIIYQAYKIIFSEKEICVKERIQWPEWVFNIPPSGSFIYTGMPICSIIAGGNNEQQVNDLLLLRQIYIKKLLQ